MNSVITTCDPTTTPSTTDSAVAQPYTSVDVLAIPVMADGAPDWSRRLAGKLAKISHHGAELLLAAGAHLPAGAMVLIVEDSDSKPAYLGVMIRRFVTEESVVRAEAIWGGIADAVLRPDRIMPHINPQTMKYEVGFSEAVLDKWVEIGVMKTGIVDRIRVCPKCQAVPTFRRGCSNCGSIQWDQEQFIHHFGCAYVGPVASFEQSGSLACPKCRTQRLVPGSDFEYLSGPIACRDCQWSDSQTDDVGQCLHCEYRFPGEAAVELELKGYHADRLDPLALVTPV